MFKQVLFTQWRWARTVLLVATVGAFWIPLSTVQRASLNNPSFGAQAVLDMSRQSGALYPLLAAAIGLLLGTSAWAADQRGRHIYALSLPIPRAQYVLLRYAAGLALLALPAIALFIGAVLATRTADIPPGLHPYAAATALRFTLACGVAYSLFFAIASATQRTAGLILGLVAAFFLILIGIDMVGGDAEPLANAGLALFKWPGVFDIFTGTWMLIDV